TATGDAGRTDTARTGSFAAMGVSAYYDSIYDVFGGGVPATAPDDDNILISHSHTESGNGSLGISVVTDYLTVNLITVDDDDCTTYKKATVNTISHTTTLYLTTYIAQKTGCFFKGLKFNVTGRIDTRFRDSTNAPNTFYDCEIVATDLYGSFGRTDTYNCTMTLTGGNSVTLKNSRHYNAKINCMYSNWNLPGSEDSTKFYYCDFSGSTSTNLISRKESRTKFYRCKLKGPGYFYSVYSTTQWGVEIISCDTGDGYWFTRIQQAYVGQIGTDNLIYLNGTYDGSNGLSYYLGSTSVAAKNAPLRHKLLELTSQDLTSDKTYTVNFQSGTTLKDVDFWLEVVRPDENDLALGVMDTTRPDNILSDGVEHDTNTESWSGLVIINQYEESITVSAMAGVDNANVEIWVNLALPNVDVWVCPEVEFS
ncbi:MAG: hypothetical protein GY829_07350, partial [Gammaproteobacteria bacterium]|nr:hypothetical protein [Gammaproteobacteria bacterium]